MKLSWGGKKEPAHARKKEDVELEPFRERRKRSQGGSYFSQGEGYRFLYGPKKKRERRRDRSKLSSIKTLGGKGKSVQSSP